MAVNSAAEAASYLSRLIGEDVTVDQTLSLRSIHRVALAAWARQRHITVQDGVLNSGQPFSLRGLLEPTAAGAIAPEMPPVTRNAGAPVTNGAAVLGETAAIGIDIEDVASLPETHDYREHPFYRDNFSPAEISYCLRQANTRAALCGTWAAKEAILKAGAPGASLHQLIDIEITRDELGRPSHPGCTISISHTTQIATAICLRNPSRPAAPPPAPPAPPLTLLPNSQPAGRPLASWLRLRLGR